MSFVNEKRDAPLIHRRQQIEDRVEIEIVIVVADDDVGPTRQLLAEIVRTDPVSQRYRTNGLAVEQRCASSFFTGGRQAIVKPARQRTGEAVALGAGVLANLVASHELEDPQPGGPDPRQRLERDRPA